MLQIANFELFSSGPKDIRLSASERYPTLEWTVIGEFVALDTRDFQSFPITPYGSFVKFIKVFNNLYQFFCCIRIFIKYFS